MRLLNAEFAAFGRRRWQAAPLIAGPASTPAGEAQPLHNPADRRDVVGSVREAGDEEVEAALEAAQQAAAGWQQQPAAERAAILQRAADLFEAHRAELMALAVREAGKSLPNAIAEVREAVDFLRYYAAQILPDANAPALGAVVCISPWNFPLAIFTGQLSAALAAGNVVLAKPAEQTPLIAHRAVQLLHEAGVPRAALQLLPGRGETVGAALTADPRVAGVIFTGSTEVAQLINRTLARRAAQSGAAGELPFIAETGGQNALIVDSSALPEQVVQDALSSAFDSAGQRCSALRVLCLQEDIAERTLAMLKGAMQELRVGNPDRLATDIGPVIDAEAQQKLQEHIDRMRAAQQAKDDAVYQLPLADGADVGHGTFVAPTVIEIGALSELQHEVFGPVLHVLRYRREQLPQLVEAINASGYGLTLGIHSRIDETIDFISSRAHVGNIYVNRNIVGAVVGVQPFGGEGKSGTGPKAGGPLYLKRLQRQAAVSFGAHTIHAAPRPHADADSPTPALDTLLAWAKTHGHERFAALAEQYAHSTPLGTTLVLPGPTGERNTLSFAPRGAVLCAAASVNALLNQLAAVLATGNRAVVSGSTATLLPAGTPAPVRQRIQIVDAAGLAAASLAIALIEHGSHAELRSALAERPGALVPIMETAADVPIALWRLVAERALCVNTTAAGGNASLMTIGN